MTKVFVELGKETEMTISILAAYYGNVGALMKDSRILPDRKPMPNYRNEEIQNAFSGFTHTPTNIHGRKYAQYIDSVNACI